MTMSKKSAGDPSKPEQVYVTTIIREANGTLRSSNIATDDVSSFSDIYGPCRLVSVSYDVESESGKSGGRITRRLIISEEDEDSLFSELPNLPEVYDIPQVEDDISFTERPPGLDLLLDAESVVCKEELFVCEACTGLMFSNRKYAFFDKSGSQIFQGQEVTDLWTRLLCCGRRAFVIRFAEQDGSDMFKLTRDFHCLSGRRCFYAEDADNSAAVSMNVKDRQNELLGSFRRIRSWMNPHFGVFDADGEKLFDIWGPSFPFQLVCCLTSDVVFEVLSAKRDVCECRIKKVWKGVLGDLLGDDNYVVEFPGELDVAVKALVVAAVPLIDFEVYNSFKNPLLNLVRCIFRWLLR